MIRFQLWSALLILMLISSCIDPKPVNTKHSVPLSESIDSMINNQLILGDSRSISNTLGDTKPYLNIPVSEQPNVYLSNKDKTEYLKMIAWYGDGPNQFRAFEMGPVDSPTDTILFIETAFHHFVSNSAIQLGMKRKEIHVSLPMKGNTVLLQSPALDLYYRLFIFENDTLVQYCFGYQYP